MNLGVLFLTFNGFWSGSGNLQTPQQQNLNCSRVEFHITQTQNHMQLHQGQMVCPPYRVNFKPFTLQLQGEKILRNGIVVGKIQNDSFQMEYLNEKAVKVQVRSEIVNGELNYTEQETNSSGIVLWAISAQLKNF